MLVIIYTVYLLLTYQQHVTESAQPVLAYWSQEKIMQTLKIMQAGCISC